MNIKELERLSKKYSLLERKPPPEKKEPSIFFNEETYTNQDWAEVKLAKETIKVNPEGERIRLKVIERLKNDTPIF